MPSYIAVARTAEVPEGSVHVVEVAGRPIALFRVDGTVYAIDDTCTHMGASLAQGAIDGDQVVCPWHGARFAIKTGEALTPPADHGVACFGVRVTGDAIEIEA